MEHDALFRCVHGHWLCMVHDALPCEVHVNGPCPCPGEGHCDPYMRNEKRRELTALLRRRFMQQLLTLPGFRE